MWTARRDPCHYDTLSSIYDVNEVGTTGVRVEVGGNISVEKQEDITRMLTSCGEIYRKTGQYPSAIISQLLEALECNCGDCYVCKLREDLNK